MNYRMTEAGRVWFAGFLEMFTDWPTWHAKNKHRFKQPKSARTAAASGGMRYYSTATATRSTYTDKTDRVIREGGQFQGGLIRGAAVIQRGEASGHGMWIDDVMLRQTSHAINKAGRGVKCRFAHPPLFGDSLGKALGRYKDARVDGDCVRADLHLFRAARKSPDGDINTYIQDMAREDAAAFGNSIAFVPDEQAEAAFAAEYTSASGVFVSPDDDNTANHPHARLRSLDAVDMVDTPAATSGLFKSNKRGRAARKV